MDMVRSIMKNANCVRKLYMFWEEDRTKFDKQVFETMKYTPYLLMLKFYLFIVYKHKITPKKIFNLIW